MSGVAPDSDSEDFVVQENKFQEEDNIKMRQHQQTRRKEMGENNDNDDEDDDDGMNKEKEGGKDQHGALVKKILESKEQLEHEHDSLGKRLEVRRLYRRVPI